MAAGIFSRLRCRLVSRLARWSLGRQAAGGEDGSRDGSLSVGEGVGRCDGRLDGWLRTSAVRWWTCRSRQGWLRRPGPRLPSRLPCGHRRRLFRRSSLGGCELGCRVGCWEKAFTWIVCSVAWRVGRSVSAAGCVEDGCEEGRKEGRKVPRSVGRTADGRVGKADGRWRQCLVELTAASWGGCWGG